MVAFPPIRSSTNPNASAPEPGADVEDDTERNELLEAEAEGAHRVDAAEREDRHEAVVVEEPRQQEQSDLPVPAQMAHGDGQIGERAPHADPAARDGLVLEEHERGDGEQEKPAGDEQVRGPQVEALTGRDAEQRRLRHENHECHHERRQSAEVADPPPVAGDASDPIRGGDRREERVVEDEADLERHVGDDEHAECDHDGVRLARRHERQRGRRPDADQRAQHQVPAPIAPIGQRAGYRRQRRDGERAHHDAARPERGAASGIVGERAGEVGRVDEGDDQRREGRVRPIVEAPRPDRGATGSFARPAHRVAHGSHTIRRTPDCRLPARAAALPSRPHRKECHAHLCLDCR